MCKIGMKALREFHTRVLAAFSSLLSRVYPSTDRLPMFLFCVPEFKKKDFAKSICFDFRLEPFCKI